VRIAAVIISDQRFAYFGSAAFAIRLLRLDQKIASGAPMSLKGVANVLGTDATLFQEFCDRFSKYGDKTLTLFADRQAVEMPVFWDHRESLLNISLIPWVRRGVVSRTATFGDSMQTIETTNPLEARRARYAQYRGQKATLALMGSTVTGLVCAVKEDRSGTLKRWIITVLGEVGQRAAPLTTVF
jgi:hypothetical protein